MINNLIISILLYFLFIDVSFWSNLRFVSFFVLIIIFFKKINNLHYSSLILYFCVYLIFILFILPSIFFNDFLVGTLSQILPFFLFPFLFLLIKVSFIGRDINKIILYLNLLMSISIILFFLLRILNLEFANMFAIYLHDFTDAGFFNEKPGIFGSMQPVVYFKYTLFLVPLAIYCYRSGYKFSFFMSWFALFVSPSRTGFILLLIFFLFNNLGFRKFLILIFVSFFGLFLLLIYDLNSTSIINGFMVRYGHLISFLNLNFELDTLLYGFGPGSKFYSVGFGSYTDGSEIAPIELVRRHGLLSIFSFSILFYAIFKANKSYREPLIYFLIASSSNPVLFIFNSFVFYSIFLVKNRGNS